VNKGSIVEAVCSDRDRY